jgi:hypothetical protein
VPVSDEQTPERSPQVTRRRAALGYDARSERRTLRGAARRRKARTRLWLAVGPAVLVIAVIVTLLVLLGGPESQGGVGATSTTLAARAAETSDLLVIEQDGTAPVVVLIQIQPEGGLALVMPGITLLKTTDSFKTLAEMHASGEDEALSAALAGAFGLRVQAMVSVSWSALRSAMTSAGIDDVPASALTSEDGEAEQIARSLIALVVADGSESGAGVWEQLVLQGDSSQFRTDVGEASSSLSAADWTAAVLAGRVVEGEGFKYLEPDVDQVEVLLADTSEGAAITVEIKNGSGMVDVVEQATVELEPLGYTLLPSGNSDDFPGAEKTRIAVALDAAGAGAQVQVLLGTGTVTKDETLEPGHVVIVLGKDYVAPAPTTTGSSG